MIKTLLVYKKKDANDAVSARTARLKYVAMCSGGSRGVSTVSIETPFEL